MKNYLLPTALFGIAVLVSQSVPVAAISPVEVQRIAKQTTVQITGCDFGSGVIIRKNGNTYTVLTVAHNFKKSGCEVTTPDDAKYQVAQLKKFPNQVDLAVFTFTSTKTYAVAKLIDNSDRVEALETIYVSGFPLSTAINSSVFTIVKGDVVANPATKQQGKGYSLIYSNSTLPGQSGGPVWNDKGEVIAIHGQGDIESSSQGTINTGVRVKTGYNLGITINTFNKLATTAGVNGNTPTIVATREVSTSKPIPAKPKPVDDLIASALQKESKSDYRGILTDMNQAIAIDAQNSRLYYVRGIAKNNLGDKKGAIEDYNRALAINPNYTAAYNNRGTAKDELGNKKGAIEDYNRAIAIDPNDAMFYYNRGNSKDDLDDKQGAIEDYNRAIAIDPNYAKAYSNRGFVKSASGDKQGAIEDYSRAIAIDPNYADAYNNRGNAKNSLGNKTGAIEDFNRVIAIDPNYAKAYYNRGIAKNNLGDKTGAIDDYNRAIAIDLNYANAYYNRGSIKSTLSDKPGAIADFKRAAQIYQQQGKTDDYQDALRRIEKLGS
jgi:tetratricopeptide (TPR) repeat protein